MTNAFLTHHEKAVRTRCHMVSRTLSRMDWSRCDTQTTCLQEFQGESTQSQQAVNRGSGHVHRQHAPSDHCACAGWADATTFHKKLLTNLTRQPSATAAQVACSSFARTIPIVHRCRLVVNSCCIKVASAGPHAALRLVPTVLSLRVLLACSSLHHHHCRIPYCDDSATPDTSLSAMPS